MTIAGKMIGVPPSAAIRRAMAPPGARARDEDAAAGERTGRFRRRRQRMDHLRGHEPRGALGEELGRELAAERVGRRWVVAARTALAAHHFAAVAAREQSAQPEQVPREHRVCGKGRVATPRQHARERALRRRRERRVAIGERRKRRDEVGAIGSALDRKRALPAAGRLSSGSR
jgi:hypothetical protein